MLNLFLLILPEVALAQVKICEIKYGQKDLEKKELKINLLRNIKNKPPVKCHKIGVEHNDYLEPQYNKPIYACCHSAKGLHINHNGT